MTILVCFDESIAVVIGKNLNRMSGVGRPCFYVCFCLV